jgi:small conductance mechanosensitive channel
MDVSGLFDQKTLSQTAQAVIDILTSYGLSVIGATLILILGWMAAGAISGMVGRSLNRIGRIDDMLRGFLASLTRYFILALTIIAVLGQFGVQTTSLVAVLGAAGLAIGLALQGTLSSLAGGAMLLLFRPFKVGDFIEASGHAGTVKALTLFTTELATPDNVRIIVPNADLWGKAIKNFSANPTRRMDLTIGLSYADDIEAALAACRDVAAADPRVLADPAPLAFVAELADSSVNIGLRLWCEGAEYWNVRCDTIKALKQAFDRNGLTIPFPQRDVRMIPTQEN